GQGRERKQAVVEQEAAGMLRARRGEVRLGKAQSEAGVDACSKWRSDWLWNGDGYLSCESAARWRDRDVNDGWDGRTSERDPRNRNRHLYRHDPICGGCA